MKAICALKETAREDWARIEGRRGAIVTGESDLGSSKSLQVTLEEVAYWSNHVWGSR